MKIYDVVTRKGLKEFAGVGGDDFILTKNNKVIAVALNTKFNPMAPEIVIVGVGPQKEKRAHLLINSNEYVPLFIKLAVDKWEYRGKFRAVSLNTDNKTIEQHRQHRKHDEVFGILFLEAEDDYSSGMLPEEIPLNAGYPEGATVTVTVNYYERNPAARAECIRHYGATCQICGFDFFKFYGPIGKGYIHVHHIVPLSKISRKYSCNPISDLLPVCGNCHGILHRNRHGLSPKELKFILKQNKIIIRHC